MGSSKQMTLTSLDAWMNPATGVGGPRDKSAGFRFAAEHLGYVWTDYELEELYEEDDMAARIVDEPTTDAMHRGWNLRLSEDDSNLAGRIVDKCDELKLNQAITEARRWARLYGQAAMFIGAEDGGKPDVPLFRENIKNVHFLHVFAREELVPHKWQDDPFAPRFGEPIIYRVQSSAPGSGGRSAYVHASRLVLFEGIPTTRRKRIERNGAGASVLLRVLRVLAQFNGAFAQALAQLADSHQNYYKLKGLSQLLMRPDGQAVITERVRALEEARSSLQALVLDSDNDDFGSRSLGGLTGTADLLDKFQIRLAAAAGGWPVTKLFGQSPAGLNATGESDQRTWDRVVKTERQDHLQPAIEEVLRCVFLSHVGPTAGREPDAWSVEWPELWELSAKEQAEVDSINGQTDQLYVDMGVLKPSDVAKARFSDKSERPALSREKLQALSDIDYPPAAPEETQDEEDTAVADLAQQMTELKVERCTHGKPNRCRVCGVEKLPQPIRDPITGAITYQFSWRPIPAPRILPAAVPAAHA